MDPDDELETLEIRLLLEAIYATYGYDLRDYAEGSMKRRVQAVLAKSGLRHLGELQHRVIRDPDFFATVLEDLTVRVTSMFRDPAFYRSFRSRVVPVLRTYPLLRIWHCGCATGEEVYADAILLSGATVGDGAVISARTLVSGNVAPYAVVGGNPMRFLRWRFPEHIREDLIHIKWWNWSRERLVKAMPFLLSTDIERFIYKANRGEL